MNADNSSQLPPVPPLDDEPLQLPLPDGNLPDGNSAGSRIYSRAYNPPNLTGTTYPWNPVTPNQPHPAQPGSAVQSQYDYMASGAQPIAPASYPTSPTAFPAAEPHVSADDTAMPVASPPGFAQVSSPPTLSDFPLNNQRSGVVSQPKKSVAKLVIGLCCLLLFLALASGAVWFTLHSKKSHNSKPNTSAATVQQPLQDISAQVKQLAQTKQLSAATVQKLNKTDAFFSAFRLAAQQPVVQTGWDVYYTTRQDMPRGDQYAFYDVSMDYRNKAFRYYEDDHSNVGVIESRCQNGQQYILNVAPGTLPASNWQPASDNSSCQLAAVATRVNDGINTGGLTSQQATAFVNSLYATRALTVGGLNLISQSGSQYLKFEVSLTPQPHNGHYQGMQYFTDAFNKTGLSANSYPYTYFGAGGEGLVLSYYVDPSTMLPVYSVAESTPALNDSGKPASNTTWSHRFVEYHFPSTIQTATLDNQPISFSGWPDH